MKPRARILAALKDGPLKFSEIRARVGGTRQGVMWALRLARDAGLVERSGTRYRYIYFLPGQKPREADAGKDLAVTWATPKRSENPATEGFS